MLAAQVLGADGVQVGSRFAASAESSANENFKQSIVHTKEGDTMLALKQLTAVRLIKNKFFQEVASAEQRGASADELKALLGRARAKKGMYEGDMEEGELEIGQVAALIREIKPAADVVAEIWNEFLATQKSMSEFKL